MDIFAAKLDSSGNVKWATAGGSQPTNPYSDSVRAVTVDAVGKSHIAGQYSGSADFGSTFLNSGASPEAAFAAALDPNGNFIQATSTGAPGKAHGQGVAVDSLGMITVVGRCSGSTRFGNASINCGTSSALFVARLDQTGKF